MADESYRKGLRYASVAELVDTLQERTGQQVIIGNEVEFSRKASLFRSYDPLNMRTVLSLHLGFTGIGSIPAGHYRARKYVSDLDYRNNQNLVHEQVVNLFIELGQEVAKRLGV